MILFSRFWDENISGLFKTFQVLNSSLQCVEKLCIFIILMIVNNIITTIMKFKGKVNTGVDKRESGQSQIYETTKILA